MSQAHDLGPPINPGEQINLGFDFGAALAQGEAIVGTPTFTVTTYSGNDPAPSGRILSTPTIVTGQKSNVLNGQVNILFDNVPVTSAAVSTVYTIACLAVTSTGQTLMDFVHYPSAPVS